jgi:hypothetical protein
LLHPSVGKLETKIIAGWSATEERKPRAHVPQIGEGIQAVAVATGDETKMNGGGLGASFAAAKEPVLAIMRSSA